MSQRKAKWEAERLNEIVQATAAGLEVPPTDSAMVSLLGNLESQILTDLSIATAEMKAIVMLQVRSLARSYTAYILVRTPGISLLS